MVSDVIFSHALKFYNWLKKNTRISHHTICHHDLSRSWFSIDYCPPDKHGFSHWIHWTYIKFSVSHCLVGWRRLCLHCASYMCLAVVLAIVLPVVILVLVCVIAVTAVLLHRYVSTLSGSKPNTCNRALLASTQRVCDTFGHHCNSQSWPVRYRRKKSGNAPFLPSVLYRSRDVTHDHDAILEVDDAVSTASGGDDAFGITDCQTNFANPYYGGKWFWCRYM